MAAQRGRAKAALPNRGRSEDPPKAVEPPPEIPEWLEGVRITVEREAPLLQILLKRAVNAVLRFTALSEDSIAKAAEAPSDLAVLVRALSSSELLDDLKQAEPLAPAFIRGIVASRRLIDDHGGALTAAQSAEVLGLSRQMVERRRAAGKLLAVSTGRHGFRYPVWQFYKSGVIPGLDDALKALASHDPWMQVAFFVSPNLRLKGRTPIQCLKDEDVDQVLEAAAVYGEHGAE